MMAQHWITRTGTKSFRYFDSAGQPVRDKEQVQYYTSLGIPPAWEDIRISASRGAKVLATGKDKAGRLQYIYHPNFRARQEQAKFERVLRFARALPRMRQVVGSDLRRPQLDYRKVMATIVSIMDRTYIRVGNDTYAKQNGSYGLTTLRSKHTTISGDTVTFDFIGKSGKHHVRRITDRTLARIVRQLDNLPGYEVFKYYDGSDGSAKGKLKDVKSSDVNQYIKDVMGEEFSAKDFRTWAGTLIASVELALHERDVERVASERQRKQAVSACIRKVAQKLGNTPAIARASYIDPRIIKSYMDGDDLRAVRDTVAKMETKTDKYLSREERCVMAVLEKKI
jgi:DNA topoisomerase-1